MAQIAKTDKKPEPDAWKILFFSATALSAFGFVWWIYPGKESPFKLFFAFMVAWPMVGFVSYMAIRQLRLTIQKCNNGLKWYNSNTKLFRLLYIKQHPEYVKSAKPIFNSRCDIYNELREKHAKYRIIKEVEKIGRTEKVPIDMSADYYFRNYIDQFYPRGQHWDDKWKCWRKNTPGVEYPKPPDELFVINPACQTWDWADRKWYDNWYYGALESSRKRDYKHQQWSDDHGWIGITCLGVASGVAYGVGDGLFGWPSPFSE